MAKTLSKSDPNLVSAVGRLYRTQKVWGGLFLAFALLAYTVSGSRHPFSGLGWLALGALCFRAPQPLVLMAVAVQMGFSLLLPLPRLELLLGPDPLGSVLEAGTVETVGMLAVRAVLLLTAANQFFFYRLLYGTARASGLDPSMPPIPEMIPNASDRYAGWAHWLGLLSLFACLTGLALARTPVAAGALELAVVTGVVALGLGLGAAFSPTGRRSTALLGAASGIAGFLLAPGLVGYLLT